MFTFLSKHLNALNPSHFEVGMEWIILYFMGVLVKPIPVKCCNLLFVYILGNSTDVDEIQPRLDLHCLPKYPFTSIQNEKN